MKRMNRAGALCLGLSLVLATACGSDDDSSSDTTAAGGASTDTTATAGSVPATNESEITASFANATNAVPIFAQVGAGVESAAEEAGIPLRSYDNNLDGAVALDNARLMVQDDPQLIIEYNLVQDSGTAIGQIFSEAGIPCVAINAPTPGCAYVNLSNKEIGIDTAEIVGAAAEDKGWTADDTTVLLLQLASSGPEINDCVAFFYTTIAPLLGMEEVDRDDITVQTTNVGDDMVQVDGGAALESAYTATKDALQTIPEGNHLIIYGVNDDSALGAWRAVTEANRQDDTLIAGLGATAEGIDELRTNPSWVAQGDVFLDYWGQYAVATGISIIGGATAPEVTPLPQTVLTKENVDDYYDVGSASAKALPPLVPDNEYLRDALGTFSVTFQPS